MRSSTKPSSKIYYTKVSLVLNDLPQINNQGHLHNLNKITCFSACILLVLFLQNRKHFKKLLPSTDLKKSKIKLIDFKMVNFI